jgi:glycosyltransferase involved in cell wall biosynthesis
MICPFEFPSLGGAETLTYELAKALAHENEIFVLSLSSNSSSRQTDLNDKNLHILSILKKGKVGLIRNFFAVFKFLTSVRCDVIHAQYVYPSAFWGLAGKILGIPVVVTSHGNDIQKMGEIRYGARLNPIIATITWVILKLTDIHVVVSKSMVKDAIEAGSSPSRIRVVYNGIDISKVSSLGDTRIVERYGIHREDFVILYLGRLHPKKSPEDMVKAFPKIVREVPNAKLVIAGKGSEKEKLEKLVQELKLQGKVIFTGFVSENAKWGLLKRCDIFVLPSIVEAFGIALIEAMACGKPVIATNVGPFPEIIKDGETGVLIPVHSPPSLADAVISLARNPEKRMLIGKKAKEEVENRFDIRKIANDYLKIYDEAVKGRRMGYIKVLK